MTQLPEGKGTSKHLLRLFFLCKKEVLTFIVCNVALGGVGTLKLSWVYVEFLKIRDTK